MDRFSILLKKPAPDKSTPEHPTILPNLKTINMAYADGISELRDQIDRTMTDPNLSIVTNYPFPGPVTGGPIQSPIIQTIHPDHGDMIFITVPRAYSDTDIDRLYSNLYDHLNHLSIRCQLTINRG
jgi:hypothetical protein